jgi:hypothetical protein
MKSKHRLTLLLTFVTAAGCAGEHRRDDAPQIGLARGSKWSLLSLQLPYLNGPFFNLVLRDHVLTGFVGGDSAPGGALRVTIDEEGAEGFGPAGPVALDFDTTPDQLVAEGTWNGSRLKLVFSAEGMRGTVADNARPLVRSPFERVPGMTPAARAATFLATSLEPPARDSSCQYVLDRHDRDGALLGDSICSGMPQQTRLEVPSAASRLLTQPELVTVLAAVLSAPPLDAAETSASSGFTTLDAVGAE